MNNCEIVSNVACGKEFQYCRTHKVEPHNCPGAKQTVAFETPFMTLEPRAGYKGIGVDLAALYPPKKREFKVGDKVRCISREHQRNYSCSLRHENSYKIGDIVTVSYVFGDATLGIEGEKKVDDIRNFELVSE